jgi:alkaline phosphatase D
MSLDRRQFVQLSAAGLAALACGDNGSARDLAVAVLEPSSDGAIVVVWARTARAATIELDDGIAVRELPLELGPTGSGAVDLAGLAPATAYEVTVLAGELRATHRVVTAPAADDPRPLRFAIVADLDPSDRYDNDLVEHLVAAAPDLIVGLGDLPYCDNGPDVAQTHDAYRDRHAETRSHPKFRPIFELAGMRAIYDDHEFRNNWDAMFVAAEPARYAAAVDVWDEFFPVREPADEVRYRSWRWGAHAECFLLDCRRFRSANADLDGPAKTMLGARQLAWLLDGLAQSTATFKLVFSAVPLDFSTGDDGWSTFRTERQTLLDALVDLSGVVVISADQHWFASHQHAFGVREVQFGPFARDVRQPGPMTAGVLARELAYNFGVIEIDGDSITLTAIGPGGVQLFTETLTAEALTPRR